MPFKRLNKNTEIAAISFSFGKVQWQFWTHKPVVNQAISVLHISKGRIEIYNYLACILQTSFHCQVPLASQQKSSLQKKKKSALCDVTKGIKT